MPVKDIKLNQQTFVPYVLRFLSLVHHAQHLKCANKICHLINESLNTLVAQDGFTSWQLIQVVSIALYITQKAIPDSDEKKDDLSSDEQTVFELLLEFLAGLLNSFLLPVYTLMQGEKLLTYFALPATKLILEFIVLNPVVLEGKGFRKRVQIWPSFCRMLNELSEVSSEKSDMISLIKDYPLPEDFDLQAFLPLLKKLGSYKFDQIQRRKITDEEKHLLRARRLIDLGKDIAALNDKPVIKVITFDDIQKPDVVSFEAVEQNIPEDLIKDLDVLVLDSSSEEEESLDDEEEENEDTKTENNNDTKKPIMTENVLGSIVSMPKKPSQRTNVAMAAIMRQANLSTNSSQPAKNSSALQNKVSFKTPSPPAAGQLNSQDSSSMSQESQNSAFNGGGLNMRPTENLLLQSKTEFSVPPPPLMSSSYMKEQRPREIFPPPRQQPQPRGPWNDSPSFQGDTRRDIGMPVMQRNNFPRPLAYNFPSCPTFPLSSEYPTLPQQNQFITQRTPVSGQIRNSGPSVWNQNPPTTVQSSTNLAGHYNYQLKSLLNQQQQQQPQTMQGPTYSLFSGPSWSDGPGSVIRGIQNPDRSTSSGASALEELVKKHRNQLQ